MKWTYSANVDYMLRYGDDKDTSTLVVVGQLFDHGMYVTPSGEEIPEFTLYTGPFMATYIPKKDVAPHRDNSMIVEAYQMAHMDIADDVEVILHEGGDIGSASPYMNVICGAIVRYMDEHKKIKRVRPDFDCDYV